MKTRGATLLCSFVLHVGFKAQYNFQNLRFNENYSHLKNDTSGHWYKTMKFTPLDTSASIYLSQGGEVRYLYQNYTNEDWGAVPVENYSSFYTRFLYHADLHAFNAFRVFTQLNSTFAVGRVTPVRAIDQNALDIQQIFMELQTRAGLRCRIGRQELLYGAQRLIAVREGPNNRQSYDAAKLIWTTQRLQIDAFYAYPVKIRQGILDDRVNTSEQLWSAYATLRRVAVLKTVDVYYIGYYAKTKAYNSGSAEENRQSLGTRLWHKSATWNYDLECLLQVGTWGTQRILAYTASLDMSYTLDPVKTKPTLGIKTEIISGDKNKNDKQLNSFNPLFPRGAYFGLAALIGPVNLVDCHPSISCKVFKNCEISADYDIFWRYSVNDGLYGPNTMLIFGDGSTARLIGHQIGFAIEYLPSAFLKLSPEIMYFYPGQYLKDIGPGKQVLFAAFTAQFKF